MTKPSTSVTFPRSREKELAELLGKLRRECGEEFTGDTPYSGLAQWLAQIAVKGEVVDREELDRYMARESLKTGPRRYLVVPFK